MVIFSLFHGRRTREVGDWGESKVNQGQDQGAAKKKTQLGSRGGATKNPPTWAQGQRSEKPPDLGPGVVRENPPDSLERAAQGQGQRMRAKLG